MSTCGGGGGGGMGGLGSRNVYTVPWRVAPADLPPAGPGLCIYWFPASDRDYDRSNLRVSRYLSLYGMRCVSMYTAHMNTPLAEKVLGDETAPAVVLTTGDGTVLNKIAGSSSIDVSQVEQLLDAQLKQLLAETNDHMANGRDKEKNGDTAGAIDEYRHVIQYRCLFPRLGNGAAERIRNLGGENLGLVEPVPGFSIPKGAKVEAAMKAGLRAELSDDYAQAENLYLEAHHLDPGDPAPLRYLAELYRHDIGNWKKARQVFDAILAMNPDPMSRAVALHGLGKMTIHEGNYKKGEELMEESVKVFPLAIACRNLAVYFNSEGDFEQAQKYTEQALKLDPDDKFNAVFAAVFMAASGKKDEALQIAKENEDLMPASYNLAAIYAQLGDKDKALALLKRHFFTYERNEEVRSKEMMEARVDRVFVTLRDDPAFMELTAGADGMLPMQPMQPMASPKAN
jgi:tetratricopeptide (TPR) repeat protein